jgi:hypothetical protein
MCRPGRKLPAEKPPEALAPRASGLSAFRLRDDPADGPPARRDGDKASGER